MTILIVCETVAGFMTCIARVHWFLKIMCNGDYLLMQSNGNLINYLLFKKCVMVMKNLQCNSNLINYFPK